MAFILRQGTAVYLCLGLTLITLPLFGQSDPPIILEGVVTDSELGTPLAFATIGIRSTTTGTASNTEGRFVLKLPAHYRDSTFFCSYMGFETFASPVGSLGPKPEIKLKPAEIVLEEIEIRPISAWEYVQRAIDRIPSNYMSTAFMTESYYSEYIAENNRFLKYTEAVVETFNPAYGDTSRTASRLIQARRRNDLGSLQFMRERIEKRVEKEKRKARRKGEDISEWEDKTIDEEVMSATLGGPGMVLRNDPIRDTASFLNPELKHLYDYEIGEYSTYHGHKVITILFESRRKHEHRKRKGKIYITLDTDAIVAMEFNTRIIIPDAVRPIMFMFGLGVTDPELTAAMHYMPYGDRWYINAVSISGVTDFTEKKLLKKNPLSNFQFHQSLITTSMSTDNVRPFSKEERVNNWKPLEEQIETDPTFWSDYRAARLERLEGR